MRLVAGRVSVYLFKVEWRLAKHFEEDPFYRRPKGLGFRRSGWHQPQQTAVLK
jgi:hypothetical protein